MHIQKITGTIKGGVEADLTEKTLIVGDNGAGKSAIVNAVELALSGGASDIEGRAWVQDVKRIKRLGDSVHVEATLSDDTTCSYRVEKSKAQHRNGVGGSLPYREVREALTGSPAKAYKFLLGQCAEGLTFDEVIDRIPLDFRPRIKAILSASGSVVEGLLEAQEQSAKKARDSAKEARGAGQAAEMAARGLGPMVMQSELDEMQEALANAQRYARLKRQAWDSTQRTARIDQIIIERSNLQSKLRTLVREVPPGAHERVMALGRVIELHLEASSPTCGVCGGGFDAIHARKSMKQLEAWQQRIDTDQSVEIAAQINKLDQEEKMQRSILEQAPDSVDYDGPTPTMTMAAAETKRSDLLRRQGAHEQFQRLRDSVASLQVEAAQWKTVEAVLDRLVKDFVDGGMAKFVERVQALLPETDVFGMTLTKSDCQIGYIRDGVLTTALSGAEWARLLTAIACACAAAGVPVVIPEERMWDRETLAKTMRALTGAPCQILLTSTVRPKGKLPAGWSLVEVTTM